MSFLQKYHEFSTEEKGVFYAKFIRGFPVMFIRISITLGIWHLKE